VSYIPNRADVGQAQYHQSEVHRAREMSGPTPDESYQRAPSQQDSQYGSMQPQPGYGSFFNSTTTASSFGDRSLSWQSTRSETTDEGGRSDPNYAPPSGTSAQVDGYSGAGFTHSQPIAIARRAPRRESSDSMYGFQRSPVTDDLRSRESDWVLDHDAKIAE
jgi:hypothetical protein